ncbi:class I SAM-dependent methyltransferase [Streptomyces sp. CAU 1734]|uniref:class I SAM-dependent methyltransferase n=1 Tax=Streptomyces sp. CAU 1734 TaxID=3140360 RepID=UPI003260BE79
MSHHDHSTSRHDHSPTAFDWDEIAPILERGAEVESPLYLSAMNWIAGMVTPAGIRRVLDVGSGPGVLAPLFAGVFPHAEVTAVDASARLLERAAARAGRAGLGDRFRTIHAELPGDLETLGEADLIWAGNSLHHLGDQGAALAGFAGLLRPGGVIALVEGGLPLRSLPRDIGLGEPGLESRLEVANSRAFNRMRTELPDAKAEVEDWRALLAAAGLVPSGSRTFLLDLPAPLPMTVREHLADVFGRHHDKLSDEISAADLAVLDRLLDPEDPLGLLRRGDTHLLVARTVHTARRP